MSAVMWSLVSGYADQVMKFSPLATGSPAGLITIEEALVTPGAATPRVTQLPEKMTPPSESVGEIVTVNAGFELADDAGGFIAGTEYNGPTSSPTPIVDSGWDDVVTVGAIRTPP